MMTTAQTADAVTGMAADSLSITGSHRRTLDAIFRHPSAHNLEWRDVVGLMTHIGDAHEKANSEVVFEVAGQRHLMHKPHSKDLTTAEVMEVRHFLAQAGVSSAHPPSQAESGILIVVDHHGAKIFHVDVSSDDAAEHVIRPYDPHHFLHHLTHKDQSRERGQRAPEEPAYYEKIAEAVKAGGRIVVLGHGAGKSNAAHHLVAYLQNHHRETYQRIVGEVIADLSSVTQPQMLDLARQALRA